MHLEWFLQNFPSSYTDFQVEYNLLLVVDLLRHLVILSLHYDHVLQVHC